MIVYKGVIKEIRTSSSVTGKKYMKEYKKGTTVMSVPDSCGIFCFDTINNANKYFHNNCNIEIIKVFGINKKILPEIICFLIGNCDYKLDDFYRIRPTSLFSPSFPPPGTVCFESVEVLE